VPIPALYDVETGDALLTETSVEHIISILKERGIDAWWEEENDDVFVAPEYSNKKYTRGYDTMDVWFDSGTSWTMLKDLPDRDPSKPLADVNLEGSDQHRGWFQSSLLTSGKYKQG
jgi:isoleucyl-tRNA synthetase